MAFSPVSPHPGGRQFFFNKSNRLAIYFSDGVHLFTALTIRRIIPTPLVAVVAIVLTGFLFIYNEISFSEYLIFSFIIFIPAMAVGIYIMIKSSIPRESTLEQLSQSGVKDIFCDWSKVGSATIRSKNREVALIMLSGFNWRNFWVHYDESNDSDIHSFLSEKLGERLKII